MAEGQNPTTQIKDNNTNFILQATRKGAYTVLHVKNSALLVQNSKSGDVLSKPDKFDLNKSEKNLVRDAIEAIGKVFKSVDERVNPPVVSDEGGEV